MTTEPRELMMLSEASHALASLRTIDEAKDLRDKAEAVKAYARKARLGKQIFLDASVIKVQAERRLGEMLRDTPLADSVPGNQHTGTLPVSGNGQSPTLDSLGITKSDSSRLQRIALLPPEEFERFIDKSMKNGCEVTTAGLLRMAKQFLRQQEPIVVDAGNEADHHVRSLLEIVDRGEKFSTVYADPPWPIGCPSVSKDTENLTPPMSIDAICSEPVSQLCADGAHLHLWTTNAFLLAAFDVLEAWGFEYKSCFVWVEPQTELGDYWRESHEYLLLGVRGGLDFSDRCQRSWLSAKRTRRSRKPMAIKKLIEQVSPPRYLEMYGRQLPLNSDWSVYGNELS